MNDRPALETGDSRGWINTAVAKLETTILNIGKTVSWLNILLILVILTQVLLRYVFSFGSVALEELQWHLYAVGIMTGLSYSLTQDTHVRLDLFHARFKPATRAWIDIFGLLFLVLPWCYVVVWHGLDFVADSWRVKEASASPTGLGCYYIIKSVIPLSFVLLALAAVTRILRMILVLLGKEA